MLCQSKGAQASKTSANSHPGDLEAGLLTLIWRLPFYYIGIMKGTLEKWGVSTPHFLCPPRLFLHLWSFNILDKVSIWRLLRYSDSLKRVTCGSGCLPRRYYGSTCHLTINFTLLCSHRQGLHYASCVYFLSYRYFLRTMHMRMGNMSASLYINIFISWQSD